MGMHLPPSPQRAQGEKTPFMKQRASLQQILKKRPGTSISNFPTSRIKRMKFQLLINLWVSRVSSNSTGA